MIAQRLAGIGTGDAAFGLVHGDMRLANLLMDGGVVKVIDFDDCGFSWYLYDCATTVSFFEHAPEVPDLIKAWARGYRRIGALSAEEEAEIATFIMLRRILLVAWIGSHAETDLARSMGVALHGGHCSAVPDLSFAVRNGAFVCGRAHSETLVEEDFWLILPLFLAGNPASCTAHAA